MSCHLAACGKKNKSIVNIVNILNITKQFDDITEIFISKFIQCLLPNGVKLAYIINMLRVNSNIMFNKKLSYLILYHLPAA